MKRLSITAAAFLLAAPAFASGHVNGGCGCSRDSYGAGRSLWYQIWNDWTHIWNGTATRGSGYRSGLDFHYDSDGDLREGPR